MFKFEMKGFDKLEKRLKQLERNVKELSKTNSVSFDELFTRSFMSKHTTFSSFDDFLKAGNFVVNSQEDFEGIPEKDMDEHVSKTTNFKSWKEMLESAVSEYAAKKLDF